MKRAATLSAKVMDNYFRERLETVIEEEKKIKHSALAEDVEGAIQEPDKVKAQVWIGIYQCIVCAPKLGCGIQQRLNGHTLKNVSVRHIGPQ